MNYCCLGRYLFLREDRYLSVWLSSDEYQLLLFLQLGIKELIRLKQYNLNKNDYSPPTNIKTHTSFIIKKYFFGFNITVGAKKGTQW